LILEKRDKEEFVLSVYKIASTKTIVAELSCHLKKPKRAQQVTKIYSLSNIGRFHAAIFLIAAYFLLFVC
jgi:hypothetical protein